MKAWRLALAMLWHTLHWRGGDTVFLALDGHFDAREVGWVLVDMEWSSNADAFVILTAEPETHQPEGNPQ